MNKKKIAYFIACLSTVTLLAGCGKKVDYDGYKQSVETLYENVVSADAKINNIDYTSANSKEEFFSSIEKLRTSLEEFAEVDAPKEFDDCEYLSSEAVKYITNAEDKFHTALDGENFDEASFQAGVNEYNNMVKCVNYIGDVLQNKKLERNNDSDELTDEELDSD